MATSFTKPKYILTGLYHDGMQMTSSEYEINWDPDWDWLPGFYVDGMTPLIDNKNANNMWGSGQKGYWRYSSDAFNTSQIVSYSYTTWWKTVGVLNKKDPSVFFRNKEYNTNAEEVYRSDNYGLSNGNNTFISSFDQLYPNAELINILGLYTPYSNGDYLLAYFFDEDENGNRTFHVYRTTNATAPANDVQWEELNIPRSDYIASIEFDPNDPDIVYLCYSNSSNEDEWPYANDLIYKIDYSNSSNPNFEDISRNLPYTNAGGLVTEKGSKGGVYLATEFGVFFTNQEFLGEYNNEWKLVGKKLPNVPSHGLEINYVNNSLRIGTYGRGVWEIELPCVYSQDEYTINDNTTWNSYRRIDRDIHIASEAKLSISQDATISMPTDSKIVIEPGGQLIIDGGTVTNGCDDFWQGIQVWGQADSSQFSYNGPCPQGKLEIINGGTIENAEIGVDLWHPDHWNSTGGIVQAEDAIFRNNAKAVHASHYHNYFPTTPEHEADNLSRFTNCTFEITDDYPGTTTFYKHVDLADVRGIDFEGCDFSVDDAVSGVSEWNSGIAAYDAGFDVEAA